MLGSNKICVVLPGIYTVVHDKNRGYGSNQKTCYRNALERGADVVIMLHPDYQYSPKLLPAIASLLATGFFDVVLGSRILGVGALGGGMPRYKYVSNRALTFFQNLLFRSQTLRISYRLPRIYSIGS